MRLRDVMSDEVDNIPPDMPVDNARELMWRQEVRHLVVVTGGNIAGVVSQHDLRRAESGTPVRIVMSAPVVTATPQMTIRDAANLMRGNRIGCLPVVDSQGRLVGMVTDSDLLDLIGKGVTRGPNDDRKDRSWVPGR